MAEDMPLEALKEITTQILNGLKTRMPPWIIYIGSIIALPWIRFSFLPVIISILSSILVPKILKLLYLSYRWNGEYFRGAHGLWGCRLEIYAVTGVPGDFELKLNVPEKCRLYFVRTLDNRCLIAFEKHYLILDDGYSPRWALEQMGFKLKPLAELPKLKVGSRIKTYGNPGAAVLVIEGMKTGKKVLLKTGLYPLGGRRAKELTKLKACEYVWETASAMVRGSTYHEDKGVEIGCTRNGITGIEVETHVLVIGASGSGKSTFIARLVEGLGREKRVLILD